ncbi:hypothetical protein [Paenibacillus oryzisoli]|uniref:Uncharacterized protein n=1 Tax=Paenibacillus oryzisoli TaxID=1850517 RepID=A0A198AJZ8_9BACL|nr:hypothetical protein [Paenibacillus oryzisoli]OAS21567.1 hypothetical protein A8708_16700 [Paenibacillus oryzisoli]
MSLKLVPLCVPTGWKVRFNEFTDIDSDSFVDENHEHVWEFKQDLLQFVYEENRTLDLGWYPEFNPEGKYKLVLIDSMNEIQPDWENPTYVFESRKSKEIIEKIEFVLNEVSKCRL